MATKLWAKGYELEPLIEQYEAARNAALDGALARHDLWGSLAHARMLRHVGLLSDADWQTLDAGLRTLFAEASKGALRPTTAQEDIHTLIENELVARVGEVGKHVHLGRSRNDQAQVDLRLYAKEGLLAVAAATYETAAALLALARAHEWTPMPGYTHMQRAMLSSVGLWASAYAASLLDDVVALDAAYALNDRSPLGSAAAYGAPLPLNRAYVAELLGFAQPHDNVLTAANARGKGEALVIQATALIMLDLSKFAQDVLLFTTSEYGFFHAPEELCDGSSIMPQKRNLSALELVRARAQTVIALQGQALATLAGLPSGYNMDYQETKAPLFEALAICQESLGVVKLFAERLEPQTERLIAACTGDLFATDRAYELARSGQPFREAYRQVASDPTAQSPGDLIARLRARTAEGAPGNLQLDALDQRLNAERLRWQSRHSHFTHALDALVDSSEEQKQ
ncbi:MAG TPA: argininosuccinate lyase [Ktedonobacterales bacterium]|nr:argininosuccinate lyase [Ktedonobacterales bacterium]